MNSLETRHEILQKIPIKQNLELVIKIIEQYRKKDLKNCPQLASKFYQRLTNQIQGILSDIKILEKDDREFDRFFGSHSNPFYIEFIEQLGDIVNDLRNKLKTFDWEIVKVEEPLNIYSDIDKFLNWLENERNQDTDEEYEEEQNFRKWEKQIREVFLAGINFVYKMYPFLSDAVDERVRNDNYESFSEVVSEDIGWDPDKWDEKVDQKLKELRENLTKN